MSESIVKKRGREINPDLIRFIAFLAVPTGHFYTHCGIYNAGYTGLTEFFVLFVRSFVNTGLALFVMLTGYFQSHKKVSAKYYLGILRLLEMYLLASVLNLIYDRFYLHQAISIREFFSGIVNFTASEYSWYILLYAGLFLMIPFLNLAYNSISCRGHKKILIISMFILSALPSSFLNAYVNLVSFWWQRLWPISFYFLGAYFAEYHPKMRPRKAFLILITALLIFCVYNFLFFDAAGPLVSVPITSFLFAHESLQNAVISPLIFLWITNIDMSHCPGLITRGLAAVSKYTYGAFLFTSITDSFIYGWLNHFVPDIAMRYIFIIPAVLLSFTSSLLIAYLADKLVTLIDRLLRPLMLRLTGWLYRLTAPDAPDIEK